MSILSQLVVEFLSDAMHIRDDHDEIVRRYSELRNEGISFRTLLVADEYVVFVKE